MRKLVARCENLFTLFKHIVITLSFFFAESNANIKLKGSEGRIRLMHNGLLWLICEKSFHTFQPHSTIFADTNAYKIMDGTDMADGLFCSSPFWLLFSISSLIVLQAFAVAAAAKLQKSMAFFGLFWQSFSPFSLYIPCKKNKKTSWQKHWAKGITFDLKPFVLAFSVNFAKSL